MKQINAERKDFEEKRLEIEKEILKIEREKLGLPNLIVKNGLGSCLPILE